ncbi:MAG: carbohydrate ABC transporter permease [Lachnospiraceae bacterium]|nr:carbohydrate ABC transporter permease [Lachnospiraceae bacterium]
MANSNSQVQIQTEKEKNTGGIKVRRAIAYVVLSFVTVLCLFWFFILFINATRGDAELAKGFTVIPGGYLIKNMLGLMGRPEIPIWYGLLNSFIIAGSSAVLATYFSTMTAYAIHTYEFKAKKFMFTFILMIMMIPTQVTALGFIRMVYAMGLENNFIPLIVPAIAAPVTFFYMKQYMDSALPLSIIEAARIDGSGEFRTFNTIALPMMKPAIAVQAIFTFVSSWNNYFTPALILKTARNKTLPLLIRQLQKSDYLTQDMGQVYFMIAFSILPVIIVYVFLSKFIVQGIALGSVKG